MKNFIINLNKILKIKNQEGLIKMKRKISILIVLAFILGCINLSAIAKNFETAYKERGAIADSDHYYSVNPGVTGIGSIAGEPSKSANGETHSYTIYNNIDFGSNTKTEKYVNMRYCDGNYQAAGCISVINFGDYEYQNGDTVTWSGDIPSIERNGSVIAIGEMLLTNANPTVRDGSKWNAPTEYFKVKLSNITGVNTVMVSVKHYCQIATIEFKEETKTAYKVRGAITDSDFSHSENKYVGSDIGGEPKDTFSYAVYNNLDFGTDTDTIKYVKEKYAKVWDYIYPKLYIYDMGEYEYKSGDEIIFENGIAVASRNGENVAIGQTLMSDKPSHTENWSTYDYFVRPIGKISGTHTIIAALSNYIRVSEIEFLNSGIDKDAYTATLGINNADSHNVNIDRNLNDVNKNTFFGALDAFKTIEWKNVNFGTSKQLVNVKISAAMPADYENQPIGILIDGEERACLKLSSTGSWYDFKNFDIPLSDTISGTHDVAVRFYEVGTGSLLSVSFEKVPYRIDFREGDGKVNATFTNNANLSNLGDDNKFVLGLYKENAKEGNILKDVSLGKDIPTFGIKSSSCEIALPQSIEGVKVKAFMFNSLLELKPLIKAISYEPKHTASTLNAYDEIDILSNTWNFAGCGVYDNAMNTKRTVRNLCSGGWIHIGNVNFGNQGVENVYLNIAQDQTARGSISLYVDSLSGNPVAAVQTENTVIGGVEGRSDYKSALNEQLTGVHDIYLKFDTDIKGDLYSIKFD